MWRVVMGCTHVLVSGGCPQLNAHLLYVFRIGPVCKDFSDLWKGLVNLDFDRDVMELIDEWGFYFEEDIRSRIISSLYGPVDSFHLCITYPDQAEHIERWVQLLSEKRVKSMAIGNGTDCTPTFIFKVPSNILNCTTIRHLSLRCCDLTPLSGLQGFVNLLSLKLKEVTITHNLLQAVVHKSPLLQELNLKFDCYRNKDGPVIIDACLLKTFYLEADELTKFWRLRLRGKCSNLTVAFIHSNLEISTEVPGNDKLNQFFNLLPNIEMLTLTGIALITAFNYDYTTDEEYGTFYENQGSVEISSSLSKFDMDILVDDCDLLVKIMLKCCPALETVRLLIDGNCVNSDEELSVSETILGYPRPESAVIKFSLAWEDDYEHMFNRHEEGYYWISN